jgi:hypothetical protein
MSDVDPRLRAHLSEQLRIDVRSGFYDEDEILERTRERIQDEVDDAGGALDRELTAEARRLIAEQRAVEATWTSPTTNDAIDRAFAELDAAGIVTLQNAGYTMSDGWSDVNDIASDRADEGATPRGATFYHGQDLERGVDGQGLMLAFGSYAGGEEHEQASLAVAREICDVLARHGVKATWKGTIGARIAIEPFDWRKRQWSEAPKG